MPTARLTWYNPDMENADFLSKQLITYLGNKRALLGFIGRAVDEARDRMAYAVLALFLALMIVLVRVL